jgi:hypothetical protein
MFEMEDWVRCIECFSNGTIEYPTWAYGSIKFIMDWKLPGSGEDPYDRVRLKNLKYLGPTDAVKFVISDRLDFEEAKRLWLAHIEITQRPVQVFYGVAWDTLTNATLVKWVMKAGLPWRLNIQTHNYIWDRRQRGI